MVGRVAFLPRHGRGHHLPPHRINYRANLWALRSVGVRQVLGPCAVGGLRPEYGPGTLLVPDQLVDRTKSRVNTYFDGLPLPDGTVPNVVHVSLADPYCPTGRASALKAARGRDWEAVDGGTLVVVEGPRFSTRAESLWHQAQGWSVVGMTGHPEAALARELELCYTSLTLVTDLDAGAETGEGLPRRGAAGVRGQRGPAAGVLFDAVASLPSAEERDCLCASALGGWIRGSCCRRRGPPRGRGGRAARRRGGAALRRRSFGWGGFPQPWMCSQPPAGFRRGLHRGVRKPFPRLRWCPVSMSSAPSPCRRSPFPRPHGADVPPPCEVPQFDPVRVRGALPLAGRLARHRRRAVAVGLAVTAAALVAAGPRTPTGRADTPSRPGRRPGLPWRPAATTVPYGSDARVGRSPRRCGSPTRPRSGCCGPATGST
ncbi:S-methyl-5'-thioadenosine phosphorylase [Streptomyces thermocarboxydus]